MAGIGRPRIARRCNSNSFGNWLINVTMPVSWGRGESSEKNFRDYAEFLHKWGVLKQKIDAGELITNELIDDINRGLDPAKIAAEAKAYKYGK